jgi:dolichyl-phosphate beta-glucosyltransferase
VRYREPLYRHWGGRLVNLVIRLLALPGILDTQCGFKCFRGQVVEPLFRCQTLHGWSFDIELLYIARLWGYRIIEVPIPWYFDPHSKVSAVNDALHMLIDILKIRRNSARGLYKALLE